MSARPRRQDAIKHIHTTRHSFDKINRLTDTHQVSRSVDRQHRRRIVQHLAHGLVSLTHSQAAQGIAIESGFDQSLTRLSPQAFEGRALLNPEQRLVRSVAERSLRSRTPA